MTGDGRAIYDSPVILEYLDAITTPGSLIPTESGARFDALRLQALADGILDAAILIIYEGRYRPDQQPYEPWLDFQRGKIVDPQIQRLVPFAQLLVVSNRESMPHSGIPSSRIRPQGCQLETFIQRIVIFALSELAMA